MFDVPFDLASKYFKKEDAEDIPVFVWDYKTGLRGNRVDFKGQLSNGGFSEKARVKVRHKSDLEKITGAVPLDGDKQASLERMAYEYMRAKRRSKIESGKGFPVSWFGYVSNSGKIVDVGENVCHYRLSWQEYQPDGLKREDVVYIFNVFCSSENTEAQIHFLHWIMNESFIKDAFITKDAKLAVESGILIDPSAPGNLVGAAAIGQRFASEHKERCESWYKLVKRGCNPYLAWWFMGNYQEAVAGYYQYAAQGSHFAISYYQTQQVLRDGAENNRNNAVDKKSWIETGDYKGVDNYQHWEANYNYVQPQDRLSQHSKTVKPKDIFRNAPKVECNTEDQVVTYLKALYDGLMFVDDGKIKLSKWIDLKLGDVK
jgi:hypothetical protein